MAALLVVDLRESAIALRRCFLPRCGSFPDYRTKFRCPIFQPTALQSHSPYPQSMGKESTLDCRDHGRSSQKDKIPLRLRPAWRFICIG
jgi:hypothetical protein